MPAANTTYIHVRWVAVELNSLPIVRVGLRVQQAAPALKRTCTTNDSRIPLDTAPPTPHGGPRLVHVMFAAR